MGKSGTAVFQHPRMGVTAGIKSPYCSYRLALVLRSLWIFELNNYVADCRRRSKMKKGPINNRKIVTHPSQLIPPNQLLYLLWCKSSSSSSSSTHTKPTDNIFDAAENDSAARRRQESISSESGLWSDDVNMDSDTKEP